MKKAWGFDGVPMDPCSLLQEGLEAREVDTDRGWVLQAVMVAPMGVVFDEGIDLV